MSEVHNIEVPGSGNESIADQFLDMNRRSIGFFINAQKAAIEELIDISNDALERANAEFSIANEFASKIAEAHSAKGLKQVYEECGKHQADFIRRDSERIFKHWKRFLHRASRVFLNQPPEGRSI